MNAAQVLMCMAQAEDIRDNSPCKLLKVGAVLVKDTGNHIDVINTACNNAGNRKPEYDSGVQLVSNPWTWHAEEICIGQAARHGVATYGTTIFITTSPCFKCARLLVMAGITEVYYRHSWWDKAVNKYLREQGVQLHHMVTHHP